MSAAASPPRSVASSGSGDPRAVRRALIAAVVVVAALLRFPGLDQGVRRGAAAGDEQHDFVEPIRQMASRGSIDPGVKPGYPGLFNHLAFLPVVAGERLAGERGAYMGARGLVAAFSVASVFLAYAVGRALAGPWAGLFAAALLALSRGEVVHAHFITPDLAVISGVLAVLLLIARPPLTTKKVVATAVTCGLTVAVKYTGLVVLPAALTGLVIRRARPRAYIVLALATALAFAAAAPFALLGHTPEAGAGLLPAIRDYYSPTGYASMVAQGEGRAGHGVALGMGWGYVRQNVGLAGSVLALVALALFRPRRELAPAAAALAVALAAILPAQIVYPRHLLGPSALVALLAAGGVRAVHDRLPGRPSIRAAVATAVALLALVPLLRPTLAAAAGFRSPDALDRAAAWMEKTVPGRPLVATSYPRFAVEERFEVRYWTPPGDLAMADVPPEVLRHYDVVASSTAALRALSEQGLSFHAIRVFGEGEDATALGFPEPPPLVPLLPDRVDAAGDAKDAAGLWSGTSGWRTADTEGWIAAEWDAPRAIARIDLVADASGGFTPLGVVIEGRDPAARWRRLRVWPLRPKTLSQQDAQAPHGQVFVVAPPASLTGLRIAGRGRGPWGLARATIYRAPEPGETATSPRVPWTPPS
jgi:hypothetical protein